MTKTQEKIIKILYLKKTNYKIVRPCQKTDLFGQNLNLRKKN